MELTLYMTSTLNGYVATENDDTPWSPQVWDSYFTVAKKFKAVILGRRTYEIMKEVNEFEKMGNPFTIVVSTKKSYHLPNLVFVSSPKEAIKVLKDKSLTKALVGGGGRLNASFMKQNLIDTMIIDIEPLIFGKGIKLFADEDFSAKLELIKTKKLSKNTIQLHYKVKK